MYIYTQVYTHHYYYSHYRRYYCDCITNATNLNEKKLLHARTPVLGSDAANLYLTKNKSPLTCMCRANGVSRAKREPKQIVLTSSVSEGERGKQIAYLALFFLLFFPDNRTVIRQDGNDLYGFLHSTLFRMQSRNKQCRLFLH